MSNFIPMLSQIDTRLLIVFAVLCVIGLVASIVKKAFKAGVMLLLVAILFGGGVPFVQSIQENYGIRYHNENQILEIKAAGVPFRLNLKELKESKQYEIQLVQGTSDTAIHLYYENKDGTAVSEKGSGAVKIPNFMAKILQDYLKKHDIRYSVEQHNTNVLGN